VLPSLALRSEVSCKDVLRLPVEVALYALPVEDCSVARGDCQYALGSGSQVDRLAIAEGVPALLGGGLTVVEGLQAAWRGACRIIELAVA
jgi:hypothetical protein